MAYVTRLRDLLSHPSY